MSSMVIKNRRSKVSPGGIITLPVAARKTLRMSPGQGSRVTVALDNETVALMPAGGPGGVRVSAKGQMELRGDPRALLERGVARHFWFELHDDKGLVLLHPYSDATN